MGNGSRSGFTITEAMIVIVVAGIIVAMAAPAMFRYVTSNRLETGADRLVADLQYARSLSISNAQILRFTNTASGYQVTNPVDGSIVREASFDHGLALDAVQTADFYPWGMADSIVLTLGNTAGDKQISILPTGIVEVQ